MANNCGPNCECKGGDPRSEKRIGGEDFDRELRGLPPNDPSEDKGSPAAAKTFTIYHFDEDDTGCIRLYVNTDITVGEMEWKKRIGIVDGLEAQMNGGSPICLTCNKPSTEVGLTLRLNKGETEALNFLVDELRLMFRDPTTSPHARATQTIADRLSEAIADREGVVA